MSDTSEAGVLARGRRNLRERAPSSSWMVLVLGILLLAPRMELATLGSSTLRLEDFVLLIVATQVALSRDRIVNGPVLAIVGVGLLAVSVATLSGRTGVLTGVLYAIRPLEYWMIFPWCLRRLGYPSTRKLLIAVIALATVSQVGTAVAQTVFNFQVGYSKFALDRAAGWTAGPYELGAICSMLAVFWVSRTRFALTGVAVLGLALSASRSSLLGAMLGVIPLVRASSIARVRVPPRAVFGVIVVGLVTVLVYGTQANLPTASGFGRIQEGGVVRAWEIAARAPAAGVIYPNSAFYQAAAYDVLDPSDVVAGPADISAVIRFTRWRMLATTQQSSPDAWLVGLGPSFAGPSVDGGILRVIFETGLLGSLAWAWWVGREWRLGSAPSRGVLVALLAGAVFIDIQVAMRVMMYALVLLAIGRSNRSDFE